MEKFTITESSVEEYLNKHFVKKMWCGNLYDEEKASKLASIVYQKMPSVYLQPLSFGGGYELSINDKKVMQKPMRIYMGGEIKLQTTNYV